jgi:nicotinate-nucleotide pyrophosphorylase (carboxylating)
MPVSLPEDLAQTVRRALAEDIGGGDLTAALIPAASRARGQVITRDTAVLCGTAWFDETFRQLDRHIQVEWLVRDGERINTNQVLCLLEGPTRAILTGERTALNFLQALSGTATTVRRYVEAVRGTSAVILDTRKTLPGLRTAQKYAVRCAGAQNHRMGLYDAILIKENHIAAAGSVTAAVQAARRQAPAGTTVEVEVENLEQLREALAAGADRLLLDNFSFKRLREAVQETAGRARLEASGGITFDNLRAIAETGVDFISIGALTKHIQAIDLSLRIAVVP